MIHYFLMLYKIIPFNVSDDAEAVEFTEEVQKEVADQGVSVYLHKYEVGDNIIDPNQTIH